MSSISHTALRNPLKSENFARESASNFCNPLKIENFARESASNFCNPLKIENFARSDAYDFLRSSAIHSRAKILHVNRPPASAIHSRSKILLARAPAISCEALQSTQDRKLCSLGRLRFPAKLCNPLKSENFARSCACDFLRSSAIHSRAKILHVNQPPEVDLSQFYYTSLEFIVINRYQTYRVLDIIQIGYVGSNCACLCEPGELIQPGARTNSTIASP